jgi:hypothetical protein
VIDKAGIQDSGLFCATARGYLLACTQSQKECSPVSFSNNGLANSRFHTRLFGINNLYSGEMPYVCAKPPCLGPPVQPLRNRDFALKTQKIITMTKLSDRLV